MKENFGRRIMQSIKCSYCKDTGKIKVPNDEKQFDYLVDIELHKGDFVNAEKAMETAYKITGFTYAKCPYCGK